MVLKLCWLIKRRLGNLLSNYVRIHFWIPRKVHLWLAIIVTLRGPPCSLRIGKSFGKLRAY